MVTFFGGTQLYQALKAEGYMLPDECRDVRIVMPVDGVFVLEYEVNITNDAMIRIGKAFVRMGEEALKQEQEANERLMTNCRKITGDWS